MLKYASRPDIARDLARSTFPLWMERGLADGVDFIIPVPLAARRLWHRGYNQAEWVAKGVADVCKLPLKTDILVRTRNNSTQTHKDLAKRKEAMSGVFDVRGNADLNGKTVLLVDDIITTGSTIADCIRALRERYRDVNIRVYSLGWSGK
jgi:ComF family protein